MTLKRPAVILSGVAALAVVALASGGCGAGAFDMSEMHQQMQRQGEPASQTPVLSDAAEVTVEIRDYDFSPRDLTVSVGTEVMWINRDSVPHDATSDDAWGTGLLKESETATVSFDEPGSYEYICTVHPYMTGTLTVETAL